MPRLEIIKAFTFEAAHRFGHMPADHPYNRLHGHSFRVEIGVAGTPDPETGWIVDFAGLEAAVADLKETLDHRMLNDIEGLENPSLENIAQWIAKELKPGFPGLSMVRVLRPTLNQSAMLRLGD